MPDSLHSVLFNPLTHQFGRKAILVLWAVDSHLLSRCMASSSAACIKTQFSQEPGSKTACLSSHVTPITVLRDYGGSPIWVHWTTVSGRSLSTRSYWATEVISKLSKQCTQALFPLVPTQIGSTRPDVVWLDFSSKIKCHHLIATWPKFYHITWMQHKWHKKGGHWWTLLNLLPGLWLGEHSVASVQLFPTLLFMVTRS